MQMTENESRNDEFLQSVKDQLYIETFITDVPEYSEEKIDALVKIIDVTEGVDEDEAAESYEIFMDNFERVAAMKSTKQKKTRVRCRRLAQGIAVILIVLLVADVTSYAFMDASLLHVIGRWTNQISILPGESDVEPEVSLFQKAEITYFTDIKAFADYFEDDFMVCSWLPEGVELEKIKLIKLGDSCNYLWNYNNAQKENIINIRMFEKSDYELAGLTGSDIKNEESITLSNGIEAALCNNDEEYMAIFEYNNWWYMVYVFSDEKMLIPVVEGMVRYE